MYYRKKFLSLHLLIITNWLIQMEKNIIETDITKAKNWTNCLSLDDDFLLIDDLNKAPFPKDGRKMNFILLCLCTKGHVSFTLDTKEERMNTNDIMIVSERHILDNYRPSNDFNGLCLMISIPFYNEIIKNLGDVSILYLFSHDSPVHEMQRHDQQLFHDYYYMIKEKMTNNSNRFRRELVRTLMQAMFYDFSEMFYRSQEINSERSSRSDYIFTQFIKMVEEHCRVQRRVSWYAQQLSITPKYLSEMVKLASKRTPNEWIDNYVTLELRVLLKNTTMSIHDIAKKMNFPNQSFLGKYFKEHTGMSPTTYRRS